MKFEPHDYQRFAVDYIIDNPIAAVFLDMGLGKTAITLTAIERLLFDDFDVSKILVIAPLRVASTVWKQESQKWEHLRHLRVSVAVGTAAERLAALQAKADIYVINRENVKWLIHEHTSVTRPFNYDMVVIDELSSFKSHKAQRFKALMRVRPRIRRIVGLTGTPSGNGLMDLWAEFRLLDMGQRLGKFIGRYREAYFQPDKRNGERIFSYKIRPDAEPQIYDKIADITISMKAIDHLPMPELLSVEHKVSLSEKERQLYDKLKRDLILPEEEITAANAAALSGKLTQMANGAVYDDNGDVSVIHDRKLELLEDLIEAANGKSVLVAYWYKHDLLRIKERFSVTELKSDDSIRRWNCGDIPVAVIHPASAGHGLNLQSGGSTLIWFGLTWSLELYLQTIARLYRQGQQSRTVTLHHIITEGTIDEQIMAALSRKERSQDSLINAVKANLGG